MINQALIQQAVQEPSIIHICILKTAKGNRSWEQDTAIIKTSLKYEGQFEPAFMHNYSNSWAWQVIILLCFPVGDNVCWCET